jgi:hypothetical protein
MELAFSEGKDFGVRIPDSAELLWADGGRWSHAPKAALGRDDTSAYARLGVGDSACVCRGELTVLAFVAPPLTRPLTNPLTRVPWLLGLILGALGALFGYFLKHVPQRAADFVPKGISPVAIRLVNPPKERRAEAQKKLERIREKAPAQTKAEKKAKEKLDRALPKAAARTQEAQALQALQKLVAKPSAGDVLASARVSGPRPKGPDMGLGALLGKGGPGPAAPVLGLGGTGTGVVGAGLLKGKGGGAVGALGMAGIGRGAVGGTVVGATSRSIGVGGGGKGSVDREAVAKVVNAHFQEVRACYERALLKNPGLAGKLTLEWTVSTEGAVVTAKTKSSTLGDAAVEGCILGRLKSWQFPRAKGGVVIVTYPFLFNSVGY